ncbi:MAG: PKD domain-containing protein [Pirellulales bacterium]
MLTYEWDLEFDGVTFDPEIKGEQPTVTFADNFAPRTIALRVTDSHGKSDIATTTLEVTNVSPAVDAGPDQTVDEGSKVTLNGTFIDPGTADTHSFLWQVSARNGQVVADGKAQNFSFTPADNGVYIVTFSVTDDDGTSASDQVAVTVNNAPPIAAGCLDRF